MEEQVPAQRQFEILNGSIARIQQVMQGLEERMARMEVSNATNQASSSKSKKDQPIRDEESEEEEVPSSDDSRSEVSETRTKRSKKDNNLSSIKLKIPEFKGTSDPELYMAWEDKVEKIFDIHDYSEKKKVKLAVVEFTDYAATWWKKLCRNRVEEDLRPVSTWTVLKRLMRKKYVPPHHKRDLYQKLQGLSQGTKSVDEYYKEMELAMMRADIDENEEATMARFMGGLQRDIAHLVELHHYNDIEDMVQMAEKVERQLKRRQPVARQNQGPNSPWKNNNNSRPPWQRNQPNSANTINWRSNPSFGGNGKKPAQTASSKGNSSNPLSKVSTNQSSIQCFRCLRKCEKCLSSKDLSN